MADQSSKQQQSRYDQGRQTIVGGQTNIGGDQHIHLPPDPFNHLLPAILAALCVNTIVFIIGSFIDSFGYGWPIAVTFSLLVGFILATYRVLVLRQEEKRQKQEEQLRKEQQRGAWHDLPLSELEETLRQVRWPLFKLVKDAEDGITLTKQQRDQWRELVYDIALLSTLIKEQGGIPSFADYDLSNPPKPPWLSRLVLRITATLSYLLSVLFITFAALIGTTIPRATETLVVKLIEIIEIIPKVTPTPTLTPEPAITELPTLTPTLIVTPTITPPATLTIQPPATVTPTVVRILEPTNTLLPSPLLTSTLSAVPTIAATAALAPLPSITITSTLALELRTRLQPPTPVEVIATPTLTPTPTVAIGTLSGYIAYPVFNGTQYDTVVHDLTTNAIVYRVSRARQPDLRGGGYLFVNREGGGLLRVDINRADERPVTERDEDARPHWAPGDDRIVFESFEQDKNTTILKLQVNSTLQSNPPYLHSPTGGTIRGRNAIFLADGRIAFNACASWDAATSGACGIWSINTDGSGILRLSDQPRDYPSDNFGSQVLFTSDRNNNWDVYLTGSAPQVRRLTDDPARDGLATTSPDGNYIVFVSDRGGQWAIWVMQADGSSQRPLITEDIAFGADERDWTTEKISWAQ